MKKIYTFLMMALFLFSSSICHAEGFDFSLFESNQEFYIYRDEFENYGLIKYNDKGDRHSFSHSETDRYLSQISPAIDLINFGTSQFKPYFNLYIFYYADEWLFINNVIVKIDDSTFTFSNVAPERIVNSGDILERFALSIIDETSNEMMKAWVETENPIRIRFKGDSGNCDFTLKEEIQEDVAQMYTLYMEAIDN